MDSRRLLEAVRAAFRETGAGTPSWPDPHADVRQPKEEEYSRCLDPGKYRILKARTDAWGEALTGLGLADLEQVADPATAWRDGPPDRTLGPRAVRLRPHRQGAVPVLLAFRSVEDVPDTVVDIGAGEPAAHIETVPDCGCDACDSGSDSFLGVLDGYLLAIVNGELIHVRTTTHTIIATATHRSASGTSKISSQELDRILTDARNGRSRYPVLRGSRWW